MKSIPAPILRAVAKTLPFLVLATTALAQAQNTLIILEVADFKINDIAYSENMVLPSVGKDAAGNYNLSLSFGLRGVSNAWNGGAHAIGVGAATCTASATGKLPRGETTFAMDEPSRCGILFEHKFTFGGGSNLYLMPPPTDGRYKFTFAIPAAQAGSSITVREQIASVSGVPFGVGGIFDLGSTTACVYTPGSCPSTGKPNNFTFAGFGAALGLQPKYTTTSSGTLKSRVVTSKVRVDSSNYDQTGNLYVAAYLPSGQLYFQTAGTWVLWDGKSYPAFKENVSLNDHDLGTIVSGYNLRSLVGTKLYVGFGKTGDELIAKQQYSLIHELVMEQADRDEIAAEEAAIAAALAAQKAKYDECAVNGCDVNVRISSGNQTTIYTYPASSVLRFGSFNWTGSTAQWLCTKFCSVPNTPTSVDQYTYTYNTTSGLWE